MNRKTFVHKLFATIGAFFAALIGVRAAHPRPTKMPSGYSLIPDGAPHRFVSINGRWERVNHYRVRHTPTHHITDINPEWETAPVESRVAVDRDGNLVPMLFNVDSPHAL